MKDNEIEQARLAIDDAIDAWLLLKGVTPEMIDYMDFSYLDNELNDLLGMVTA